MWERLHESGKVFSVDEAVLYMESSPDHLVVTWRETWSGSNNISFSGESGFIHYAGLVRGHPPHTETSTYGLQSPLDQTRSISVHFCPRAVRGVQNEDWPRHCSDIFLRKWNRLKENSPCCCDVHCLLRFTPLCGVMLNTVLQPDANL